MQTGFVSTAINFTSRSSIYRTNGHRLLFRQFLGVLDRHNIRIDPTKDASLFRALSINPKLLSDMNIKDLYFVSESARAKPTLVAGIIEGLNKASTHLEMHKAVVDGIELGILCFTEKQVTEDPSGFDNNIERLVASNCKDFKIVETHNYPPNSGNRIFSIEIDDIISGQKQTIKTSINTTMTEFGRWSTAKVTLPWNNPYLAARFNELFGCNWYSKYRLRFVYSSDYHDITYVWGSYEGVDQRSLKICFWRTRRLKEWKTWISQPPD